MLARSPSGFPVLPCLLPPAPSNKPCLPLWGGALAHLVACSAFFLPCCLPRPCPHLPPVSAFHPLPAVLCRPLPIMAGREPWGRHLCLSHQASGNDQSSSSRHFSIAVYEVMLLRIVAMNKTTCLRLLKRTMKVSTPPLHCCHPQDVLDKHPSHPPSSLTSFMNPSKGVLASFFLCFLRPPQAMSQPSPASLAEAGSPADELPSSQQSQLTPDTKRLKVRGVPQLMSGLKLLELVGSKLPLLAQPGPSSQAGRRKPF